MDNNTMWLETPTVTKIEPQVSLVKIEKPTNNMLDGDDCYLSQAERLQILRTNFKSTNPDNF